MPTVLAVALRNGHHFSKTPAMMIRLFEGLGVEGDSHAGTTVKHLYQKRKTPDAPNLRQVHLIHAELFDELASKGFVVKPGDLGENVTTRNIDLLDLPTGTLLHLGDDAIVEVTGLRNPCVQIDGFQKGLMAATLDKIDGQVIRKTGIMSVVRRGGDVRPGDPIRVELPADEHRPLQPV